MLNGLRISGNTVNRISGNTVNLLQDRHARQNELERESAVGP
jgi:hypothetical protein